MSNRVEESICELRLPPHKMALIVQTLLVRVECPVACDQEKGAIEGLLDDLADQLPEELWDDERPGCERLRRIVRNR